MHGVDWEASYVRAIDVFCSPSKTSSRSAPAHPAACCRFLWFRNKGRGPHISLVFREMWDTSEVDRSVRQMHPSREGRYCGIPHLAKNTSEMWGHPAFVSELEESASWIYDLSPKYSFRQQRPL